MQKQLDQDPLQEILERHLVRSSTESERSTEMIQAVLDDYLLYLKSKGVHIPGPVKDIFIKDLKEEIRELTIKRTFGAVAPEIETGDRISAYRALTRKLS